VRLITDGDIDDGRAAPDARGEINRILRGRGCAMTLAEALSIIATLITGIVVPLVGLILVRRERHRDERWQQVNKNISEMHDDVRHLDECLDDLKTKVLSQSVTRADLAAHEVEMRAALAEQRMQVGQDTNGLHQRVFRLENHAINLASVQ